ncbi:unnamed protein product [Clonostachys chloroleuca]|uniref:Eukaryotic translation initiation factor 3 subunit D n=1 Tax=Clonostachys chloroleuca TaxID=1926264 RepID=A0AA35QDH1_9HYPO|nr:unnamed protein product [Clonostachys chloroleuca]
MSSTSTRLRSTRPFQPSEGRKEPELGGGLSSLSLDVFKTLIDRRNVRSTDEAQPKRRGPKPDRKPALTRRQELNRQAQRTHRERKEMYITSLEDEVLRLKEVYSTACQEKAKLIEENKELKSLLVQHGVSLPSPSSPESGPYQSDQSGLISPTLRSSTEASTASPNIQPPLDTQKPGNNALEQKTLSGIDYDQAGIDFVLALERPCMDHMPVLLDVSSEAECQPCGHALMVSCPPRPFDDLSPEDTFGQCPLRSGPSCGQRTWKLEKGDLSKLLELSSQLDLDGEVTPVMAWTMILAHPRSGDLKAQDFVTLAGELQKKIRCYGFGAVTEEFEVRDAIENVLGNRLDCRQMEGHFPKLLRIDSRKAKMSADTLDYVRICESCPPGDGWGPSVTTETTLDGVPYAPFSKGDKLGRMADWTLEGKDRERGGRMQYNRSYRDQQVYGASHAVTFNAPAAEDESTFSIVTNTRDSTKTRYGRGAVFTRGRGQRGGRGDARGGRGQAQRSGPGGRQSGYDRGRGAGGARGRRFGWKDYDKPARNRDASVAIRADWELLEEIDFNRLAKLNLDTDEGEDLEDYGFLYPYDRSYDKPPVKGSERKLTAIDRAAYNITTSNDPIIQELAEKDEATIFATDSILSMLMCSTRSVYPWDIVIVRQGNKIFLDKRENATLDMVTVNENAADSPLDASEGSKDSINQPAALAEEATYINHNFANQVVNESESAKVQMAHSNPFYNASEDTDPPASKAYRYRRFDLSTNEEDPVYLIVRTEVDAVQKNSISGEDQLMTIKALNEFDSKAQGSGGALDWRSKLVTQRGAVVATEMKNNSCKLARWTVQSILSKSDIMKLGFVSRANPRSNDKHVILGVIGWKPRDFANQMNLSLNNGWGIVRTIADMCLQRDDGKFVLVKDPNKSILRLYEVPVNTFEEDEDDEDGPQEEAEAEGAEE